MWCKKFKMLFHAGGIGVLILDFREQFFVWYHSSVLFPQSFNKEDSTPWLETDWFLVGFFGAEQIWKNYVMVFHYKKISQNQLSMLKEVLRWSIEQWLKPLLFGGFVGDYATQLGYSKSLLGLTNQYFMESFRPFRGLT